ncbi:uncharacterized protein LOC135493971 isoform X2 [Lineus longissimus]|uniref:uncharacterized protein LOC135493971 isoform X2 n=1 Tax=Lineus longissimus TaxID=88925 RepID=UPI00315D4C29
MDPCLFVQPTIEEIKLHKNHYQQSVVSSFFEKLDQVSSSWHNHSRGNKIGVVQDLDLLNGDPRLSYPCLAQPSNQRSRSPKSFGKDNGTSLQRRSSLSDLEGRYSFRKKRTAAQKVVGISDREMKAVIMGVANELSIIYEYHISVLYGLADVELLAENAVDCMFHHLKQNDVQFCYNDMLKSVIEAMPKTKIKKFVYLRTNDGKATLAWNVVKVYKQAGLRLLEDNRAVSELPRYKFFRCFSPFGQSCKPDIYGFRGPMMMWEENRQVYKILDQDMTTIQHGQHTQMAHTTKDMHQLYKPFHCVCDLQDLIGYRNSLLDTRVESFNMFLQTSYSLNNNVMAVLRHKKPLTLRLDLYGANLSRCDLSKLAINKFSFKLDNVQLRNSILLDVDFSGLIITNVSFVGADLSFSNLSNVTFCKCHAGNFEGAKLKYVLTENTDLPVELSASKTGISSAINMHDSGAVVKLIRRELIQNHEFKIQTFCDEMGVSKMSELTKLQPITLQKVPEPGDGPGFSNFPSTSWFPGGRTKPIGHDLSLEQLVTDSET